MAVVIACLLDKFIITMQEVKEQDEKAEDEGEGDEAEWAGPDFEVREGLGGDGRVVLVYGFDVFDEVTSGRECGVTFGAGCDAAGEDGGVGRGAVSVGGGGFGL